MGVPATLEEQEVLARQYCPDILEQLRKAKQNLVARKYRQLKVESGLKCNETIRDWVLRMRKEIAEEIKAEMGWKIELLTKADVCDSN